MLVQKDFFEVAAIEPVLKKTLIKLTKKKVIPDYLDFKVAAKASKLVLVGLGVDSFDECFVPKALYELKKGGGEKVSTAYFQFMLVDAANSQKKTYSANDMKKYIC
mmetsp:Transcript_6602/g.11133  ORF Transcript_6602/g.11133 Transcript_6602/m.11133 type:complete len:106 (-) Transcript_6602:199-516(-)